MTARPELAIPTSSSDAPARLAPCRYEFACISNVLGRAQARGRARLFEHEVYDILQCIGGISPPVHHFLPIDEPMTDAILAGLPGRRVVVKIVSPDIVHKTEARAVIIVPHDLGQVREAIKRLYDTHAASAKIEGVLLVEFVEGPAPGFGSELFVGLRNTPEFGPVVAAGLGGVDTEFLARAMRPGVAVAKAVAMETSVDQFMALFQRTAAYDVLSGRARGHIRVVSDEELRHCFDTFLRIAKQYCVDRSDGGQRLAELEVNPFAFRDHRMVPLDGRGSLGYAEKVSPSRPLDRVTHLIEPRTIAVLGVSATAMNLGRIVLNNVIRCGYPVKQLTVIKEHPDAIDGVACVNSLEALPRPADLLVVAAPAEQLPGIIRQAADSGKVGAAILIPGGAGETDASAGLSEQIAGAIADARSRSDGGPVFLGPNCLGVRSEPGRYDTFFIPAHKLGSSSVTAASPAARLALLSQSGAFIITRLSNLEVIRPTVSISVGNQADLRLSDFVDVLANRADIDVIGIYAEGFRPLDGAHFLRGVARATSAGKLVVLYKAGRTGAGRSAAAGHTAAVAGDYDVCQAAAAEAGALVVDTFKEFEQVVELACAFHGMPITGRRIGVITNAGYEAVGMADTIRGPRYSVQMAQLSPATIDSLRQVLHEQHLERLVNPRNPLDLTPMAGEIAYENCARAMLAGDDVDAMVVSVVPLTPALLTTEEEIRQSGALNQRLPAIVQEYRKPLVFVLDCGSFYDPLARAVRRTGIPVYRTCDQAIRSLGRYLDYRATVAIPR